MKPEYTRRTRCRACDVDGLAPFLSLGPQPLANALPASPQDCSDEATYPLDVAICSTCGLVQILDVIDPETLFGHYLYVTGVSSSIHEHNRAYASDVVSRLDLGAGDLVVEVASNDGSLLKWFQEEGTRVLGVEPARNIAEMANEAGIPTESVFFGAEVAEELVGRHGLAKAVVGNNVLAHVEGTIDFLSGMARMLAPGGLAVVEVPYLGEFVDRLEYDTVYHEHHCYFSVGALMVLAERAGLRIADVVQVPIHGGSARVFFAREQDQAAHAPGVLDVRAWELEEGLLSSERFEQFARDVERNREELHGLLDQLKADGLTVAAYGAPAKGNTLLNYCGIGTDHISFTVDRNPLKVGRYLPGSHIPVLGVEAIEQRAPDVLLMLPWNFAEEILGQQADFRARGGRFILPVPHPRIV